MGEIYRDFTIIKTNFLWSECFYIYKSNTKRCNEVTFDSLLYLSNKGKLANRQDQDFHSLYMFSVEEVEIALSIFYREQVNLDIKRTQKEIL